ncbi:hypothetical protein A9995_15280 [Erythrobacter sp. QSSC1-22B]|nr:hypothetical protein A9995_15280 [Erythrobacter sp. QSSC1-22B]
MARAPGGVGASAVNQAWVCGFNDLAATACQSLRIWFSHYLEISDKEARMKFRVFTLKLRHAEIASVAAMVIFAVIFAISSAGSAGSQSESNFALSMEG